MILWGYFKIETGYKPPAELIPSACNEWDRNRITETSVVFLSSSY